MKEFTDLRTSLRESSENLEEHSGILQGAIPPNILILRRKSIRQFPDHTMVALYYNDKLDQYFSIPYGGDVEDMITPGALKEEREDLVESPNEREQKRQEATRKTWEARRKRWDTWKASQPKVWDPVKRKYVIKRDHLEEGQMLNELRTTTLKSYVSKAQREVSDERRPTSPIKSRKRYLGMGRALDKMHKLNEGRKKTDAELDAEIQALIDAPPRTEAEQKAYEHKKQIRLLDRRSKRLQGKSVRHESVELNEDVIQHLRDITSFQGMTHINHDDGTQTHVDPTTANALLTVHDALKLEHQTTFVEHLKASQPTFHKMLDFTRKQVE